MFICLCNALKDSQMCGAIADGAQCVSEVYKSLGCQPKCGKCVPYVREQLSQFSASAQSVA
jgi:bacterioferritin-associated ferredoxin